MSSLRASEQGKSKIRQARVRKGKTIDDPIWLVEASKILKPEILWTKDGLYANGASLPTWKRFLEGKSIRCDSFKAFCQVLELNWKEICQADELFNPTDFPQPFEILRKSEESQCCQIISQPGSLLRIKGPQQMGKTLLLNQVLAKVKENDYQIVVFHFQSELASTDFDTLEEFLQAFCVGISYLLELPDNFGEYWHDKKGTPNHKTTVYFAEHLLPQIHKPLVLILEDVDRVFEHSLVANDFCSLLRGWHEKAQRDELWQKLRWVIVHSTNIYASLDINSSPLANIGETIQLDELTKEQVQDLVRQYKLNWNDEQIDRLMTLIGGHPYLVNHALKTISYQSKTLEEILAKAATEESIYRNHLRRLWGIIQQQPTLKEALKKVVNSSHPVRIDPFQLDSMGLVKVDSNNVTPRCLLYRQYFSTRLTEGENS